MTDQDEQDAAVLATLIGALQRLSPESRQKVIETVSTFFQTHRSHSAPANFVSFAQDARPLFSEDREMSAKQFLTEKQPRTDVERIACLAFYLTHYRDTPYFKTLDLSKLNTEAAQPKFSNPTVAVENATKMRYLVPAAKGQKQLSAAGERFVQALPDRETARSSMTPHRRRRTKKAPKTKSTGD